MLATWIVTGQIAWLIIATTVIEAACLVLHRRLTGGGVAMRTFLPSLLAGDFLLLAWATNAAQSPWIITAASLLAALACHLVQAIEWVSAA